MYSYAILTCVNMHHALFFDVIKQVHCLPTNSDNNVVKWGKQCCQMMTAMLSNGDSNIMLSHGESNVVKCMGTTML